MGRRDVRGAAVAVEPAADDATDDAAGLPAGVFIPIFKGIGPNTQTQVIK